MYAQVLSAQLKKGALTFFEEKINEWKNNVGFNIRGCTDLIFCNEEGGADRIVLLVMFETLEAQEEFNNSWQTLKLFDDAKVCFTGSVQFYQTNSTVIKLSDV